MLSVDEFRAIFPRSINAGEWVRQLNNHLPLYEINTPKRIAAFLAQCGHESAGFSVLKENLNYSAQALNAIFPKYFVNAGRNAEEYHRQPEKIANIIYANRMGNGDTLSGDGWKFRGRGLIQLTGRSNYKKFSEYLRNPEILTNPDLLTQFDYAIISACWFWTNNSLNSYADNENFKGMTKVINGGYNGLQDRINLYEQIKRLIQE